jgi:hypothetical protein
MDCFTSSCWNGASALMLSSCDCVSFVFSLISSSSSFEGGAVLTLVVDSPLPEDRVDKAAH